MILLIFVEKTDFDDKLNSLNKKVTSKKTKHALVENKFIELSKKVELILTKGLIKYLINNCSNLNSAKCFSSNVLQNYLIFTSANK